MDVIFADHTIWHTAGENAVWIAAVVGAIAVVYKTNWITRPIKWVWKRLVSEPVSSWGKNVITTVIAESPAIMGLADGQALTTAEMANIHNCIDTRFTETQAQIDQVAKFADRVVSESSGNRDRIRQVYSLQTAIVFETDASGNFTYFNPAFTDMTGLAAEDALGMGWSSAIHPDDQARVFKGWANAKTDGRPFVETFRLRGVLGTGSVTVRASAAPLRDGIGGVVGWIGTAEPLLDVPAITMGDTAAPPKDDSHA